MRSKERGKNSIVFGILYGRSNVIHSARKASFVKKFAKRNLNPDANFKVRKTEYPYSNSAFEYKGDCDSKICCWSHIWSKMRLTSLTLFDAYSFVAGFPITALQLSIQLL